MDKRCCVKQPFNVDTIGEVTNITGLAPMKSVTVPLLKSQFFKKQREKPEALKDQGTGVSLLQGYAVSRLWPFTLMTANCRMSPTGGRISMPVETKSGPGFLALAYPKFIGFVRFKIKPNPNWMEQ